MPKISVIFPAVAFAFAFLGMGKDAWRGRFGIRVEYPRFWEP